MGAKTRRLNHNNAVICYIIATQPNHTYALYGATDMPLLSRPLDFRE